MSPPSTFLPSQNSTDHSNPVISNFHFLFPVVPNFHFLSQPTMLILKPLTHLMENYFSFSTFVYRRCSEKRITAIIYFRSSGRDHHNSFFLKQIFSLCSDQQFCLCVRQAPRGSSCLLLLGCFPPPGLHEARAPSGAKRDSPNGGMEHSPDHSCSFLLARHQRGKGDRRGA